jgi:hypothetical protein
VSILNPHTSTDNRIKGTEAMIELIRNDPWVKRADPLLKEPGDATFDDEAPTDRLWLRLTPRVTNTKPICSIGLGGVWAEVTMTLTVEIKSASFGWTEAAQLWEEIEAALGAGMALSARQELYRRLKAQGVLTWRTEKSPDADKEAESRITMGVIEYRVVVRQ